MRKFGFFITMLLASSLFFSGCGGGSSTSVETATTPIAPIAPVVPPVVTPVGEVPIITLNGDNPQVVTIGEDYIEAGATAADDIDGDITASIVIDSSDVNTSVINNYYITYNVTDSDGNAAQEVIRVVSVRQDLADIIQPEPVVINGTTLECLPGDVDTTSDDTAKDFNPSATFKANVSSPTLTDPNRQMPTAQNSLERMDILVDGKNTDGTPLGAKVYPLVMTYTQQAFGDAYEMSDGDADIGDPDTADGIYLSFSLDDGLSWKKETIADFTGQSSRDVNWSDVNVSYPGHSHKPNIAIDGDKIVVAWHSKYCLENPLGLIKDQVTKTGYPFDYFLVNGARGSQGDVTQPGKGSYQGSIDYEGQEAPNGKLVYEVPFSCVWTKRGTFNDTDGNITWQAPKQLTSGARDTNHLTIAADEVGFAMVWQEDTEGMHAGEGGGPGAGWSGATANHGTDIWYSSLKMTDFDSAGENFAYPVRITDNEKCAPGDTAGYCKFLCDTYASVDIVQGGGSPTDELVSRCLTYDFDMLEDTQVYLNGDTGASRPAVTILTTDQGEKVVVIGYEETKGLSITNDTPDAETNIELEGKAVYFESFHFGAIDDFNRTKPDTILDVAMPLVSAGNILSVKVPQENNETHLIYENARRLVIGEQMDACDADRFTFAFLYKQSFDTKGESSDMFVRVNNGFTYDSFVPLNGRVLSNVSAQVNKEVADWQAYAVDWSVANLEDYTYENKQENTFSPRIFLRGNTIYVGFEYTPNYKVGKLGRFPNNFHHNIYDGTEWRGPVNVTDIDVQIETSVDARFFTTPSGVPGSPLASDQSNKDVLFITWGSVDADDIYDINSTTSEGNIYGKRSTDNGMNWGPEFIVAAEKDGYPTAIHEKEVNTLVTPDGKTLFNVWLQEEEVFDANNPASGLDSWFGLIDFNIPK